MLMRASMSHSALRALGWPGLCVGVAHRSVDQFIRALNGLELHPQSESRVRCQCAHSADGRLQAWRMFCWPGSVVGGLLRQWPAAHAGFSKTQKMAIECKYAELKCCEDRMGCDSPAQHFS